ncbi:MAG: hypothetical protein ABI609_03345 [Acidobacteriota bacterium]
MNQMIKKLPLALALLALAGCNASTDKTDSPVILTIVGSTTIVTPLSVSVSNAQSVGVATIGSMTLTTLVKEPNAVTSNLETVEMESYLVTYTRTDRGTRLPPPLQENLFGTISPGGTFTLTGFPFMRAVQLTSVPLSDLATRGRDAETGTASIPLIVNLRFFGHTLSGKAVASETKTFSVEMLP